MSSLKSFSEQQGFELIAQNLDTLSSCISQLNNNPEYEDIRSRGLCGSGWISCAAGALAEMRGNVGALERLLAENPDGVPEKEME